MNKDNFLLKTLSWFLKDLTSWASVCRFLRSLEKYDDLDFYQGLDERATRSKDSARYRVSFSGSGGRRIR